MTQLTDPDSTRAFYTIAQVAIRWQVSTKKIVRLIHKGELIAHKFGSQWRIGTADLTAYERLHRLG